MKKTIIFLMVLITLSVFIKLNTAQAEHSYFYNGEFTPNYPTLVSPMYIIKRTYLLGKSDSVLIVAANTARDPGLDNVPCFAMTQMIWGASAICEYPSTHYSSGTHHEFTDLRHIPVSLTFYDTKTARIISFFALSADTYKYVKANPPLLSQDRAFEKAIQRVNFDKMLWFPPKKRYSGSKFAELNKNIKDSCYTITVGKVADEKLMGAFNNIHAQKLTLDDLRILERYIANYTGAYESGLSSEGKICLTGMLLSVNDIIEKFKGMDLDFSKYKK